MAVSFPCLHNSVDAYGIVNSPPKGSGRYTAAASACHSPEKVPSPRVFDRKTLPGIKWIREEHYRLRHRPTISRRGGTFQVGHGVLQYGGRKAVRRRVDESLPIVQDRVEKE